jgi:hypothetical protein
MTCVSTASDAGRRDGGGRVVGSEAKHGLRAVVLGGGCGPDTRSIIALFQIQNSRANHRTVACAICILPLFSEYPVSALLPPDPLKTVSSVDRGDDMQRRVYYQAAYLALLALALLVDKTELEELYCEHLEDGLLRRTDGKCIGCQVKTRELHLGPFRAGDEVIRSALIRFAILDKNFPGVFLRFVIATNCGFWQGEENASNLPHVVRLARRREDEPRTRISVPIRAFIRDIAQKAKVTSASVLSMLRRVENRSPAGDLVAWGKRGCVSDRSGPGSIL